MGDKGYTVPLTDSDQIRVRIVTRLGGVTGFTLQYEAEIDGVWYPVVRYDNAHGFPHRDLLSPDGQTRRWNAIRRPLKDAITEAKQDLTDNWTRYRSEFEREVGQ